MSTPRQGGRILWRRSRVIILPVAALCVFSCMYAFIAHDPIPVRFFVNIDTGDHVSKTTFRKRVGGGTYVVEDHNLNVLDSLVEKYGILGTVEERFFSRGLYKLLNAKHAGSGTTCSVPNTYRTAYSFYYPKGFYYYIESEENSRNAEYSTAGGGPLVHPSVAGNRLLFILN